MFLLDFQGPVAYNESELRVTFVFKSGCFRETKDKPI